MHPNDRILKRGLEHSSESHLTNPFSAGRHRRESCDPHEVKTMAARLTVAQIWQREKYIKGAAIRGLGANKTLEALKGLGLGIKRAEGLRMYRGFAKIPEQQDRMKYVNKSARFSRDMYTVESRFMTRRYRYTMKFETYDKRTGEISEQATSVISDRPMTPGEIESEVDGAINDADTILIAAGYAGPDSTEAPKGKDKATADKVRKVLIDYNLQGCK